MSNKKYIELNINGIIADLPAEGIDIQMTYVNPCAGGFGTISGNKSERSFNLPATKQNDSIFESYWNESQVNPAAVEEKDGAVYVNGVEILSGKVQLKTVEGIGVRYDFKGKNYQTSFVGNNADWFLLLKDKELGRDLDWTAENHTFDGTTIQSGFNQAPANGYAYGVIKLKGWANLESPPNTGYLVSLFECTPLLYIGHILNKIFNSIGYTLNSTFWANFVNERYVMPVPLPEKYPQDYSEDRLNIIAIKNIPVTINSTNVYAWDFDVQTKIPPISNPFQLSVPATLPVSGVGNTGQYTAPNGGFYSFTLRLSTNNVSGTVLVNITITTTSGSPIPPTYTIGPVSSGMTYDATVIAELEAGDVVEFYYAVQVLGIGSVDITGEVEVNGEAQITDGSPIDFTYLLNTWKQTDLIKGVTAAFNLCWETDPDLKTVLCEPKDNYLLTNRAVASSGIVAGFHSDNTNDLTYKVDLSKEKRTTAKNEVSEIQKYQWLQDGGDKTAESQNNLEDLPFDGGRYNLPANRFKKDTEEYTNPFFAPTLMYYDETIRPEGEELTPLIPLMWPDDYTKNRNADQNGVNFEPRILWFGGQRGGDGKFRGINPSGSPTTYLLPAREGKEIEISMYWDELDILGLSFRPKLFLFNNLYILKEINSYSPVIDRTTKTTLVYDLPPEQEDVNRIQNTLSIGYIIDFPNPDK
jgi:hypothetical protein